MDPQLHQDPTMAPPQAGQVSHFLWGLNDPIDVQVSAFCAELSIDIRRNVRLKQPDVIELCHQRCHHSLCSI